MVHRSALNVAYVLYLGSVLAFAIAALVLFGALFIGLFTYIGTGNTFVPISEQLGRRLLAGMVASVVAFFVFGYIIDRLEKI